MVDVLSCALPLRGDLIRFEPGDIARVASVSKIEGCKEQLFDYYNTGIVYIVNMAVLGILLEAPRNYGQLVLLDCSTYVILWWHKSFLSSRTLR